MPWEGHILQVLPVVHKIEISVKFWLDLGTIGERLVRSLRYNTLSCYIMLFINFPTAQLYKIGSHTI